MFCHINTQIYLLNFYTAHIPNLTNLGGLQYNKNLISAKIIKNRKIIRKVLLKDQNDGYPRGEKLLYFSTGNKFHELDMIFSLLLSIS